jgi:cysteine desulfurase
MLYLDYAASTPIRPEALKVLESSFKNDFANPSSAHKLGKTLYRKIESCRRQFLEFLGAGQDDLFIFTSSATESNNMLIEGLKIKEGDTVIYSSADHPSVTGPIEELKKRGIETRELPLEEDGQLNDDLFLEGLKSKDKLVILTHVNNQSGMIIDICALSLKIKEINPKIHIHVDAAQSFGKIPFSLKEGKIDSISISSHKLGGPKGIAGLYLHSKVTISPFLVGGGQEKGLRSSTQAAPLIFSFCEASKIAYKNVDFSLKQVSKINQLARENLTRQLSNIRFPFSPHGSPYILTFILTGLASDILLRHLEEEGIFISSTAACSSKVKGINPVYTALNIPENEHKSVLRVSLSEDVSDQDIKLFCDTFVSIYKKLEIYIKGV